MGAELLAFCRTLGPPQRQYTKACGGALGGPGCSVRLGDEFEVLDHGWPGKKRTDDGSPFSEKRGFAKADRVILQCVPENLQDEAVRRLDASVYLESLKTLGFAGHGVQSALYGFFKGSLLPGVYADVGKFENHGLSLVVQGVIYTKSGFSARQLSGHCYKINSNSKRLGASQDSGCGLTSKMGEFARSGWRLRFMLKAMRLYNRLPIFVTSRVRLGSRITGFALVARAGRHASV